MDSADDDGLELAVDDPVLAVELAAELAVDDAVCAAVLAVDELSALSLSDPQAASSKAPLSSAPTSTRRRRTPSMGETIITCDYPHMSNAGCSPALRSATVHNRPRQVVVGRC